MKEDTSYFWVNGWRRLKEKYMPFNEISVKSDNYSRDSKIYNRWVKANTRAMMNHY